MPGRLAIPQNEWPADRPEKAMEPHVDAEERTRMVAEAAYFRAERRGFSGGDPVADWVDAEAEVDAALHGKLHGEPSHGEVRAEPHGTMLVTRRRSARRK